MEKKHRDFSSEAVSPVIGVMLMLVVTIIIAAAVSAYAGGMVSDQEETPTAQLNVQLKSGEDINTPKLVIKHLGGDPLNTEDLKIITYYHEISRGDVSASEETHKHTTDGSLDPSNSANHFDLTEYVAGNSSFVTNNGYPCTVSDGVPVKYWGDSIMLPGDVYTTIDAASLESIIGTGSVGDEPVEIDIIYIPSGGTLYSGQVVY